MKNAKWLVVVLILFTTIPAPGQILKKLKDRAEQAVTNKTGEAVEKGINKATDKALAGNEKQETETPSAVSTKENTSSSANTKLTAYSKFDFVAGDKILLADDFSQDAIGEFPKEWNTNNKGEVVKLDKDEARWLKLAYNTTYISPFYQTFPENFTMEFDVIMDLHNKGYGFPAWDFHFYYATGANTEFRHTKSIHSNSNLNVKLVPGAEGTSHTALQQTENGSDVFQSQMQRIKFIESLYGKPMHVAISVQGQRFRMWINEVKVYDLPKVYPVASKLNKFAITISNTAYAEEDLGLYITNFKVAAGMPDTRSKILTEGKYSTTAITFNVGSDQIKESSLGAVKEIAEVLKANTDVRIRIVGHTDSDGTKEANQILSEKRAKAVKNTLMELYKIDESRIETTGKGSSEPAGDNKTTVGKAENRRVEFIKL
jgi:OmpA-OmpF porin, OOP family